MKFDFSKSREDFRNKYQLELQSINKNVLYITHEIDKCLRILRVLQNDARLQSQVDDFYNKDDESEPKDEAP